MSAAPGAPAPRREWTPERRTLLEAEIAEAMAPLVRDHDDALSIARLAVGVCVERMVSRGAPTPAMIAAAASVLTAAYRGTANGAPEAIQRIAEGALRAALTAPEPSD